MMVRRLTVHLSDGIFDSASLRDLGSWGCLDPGLKPGAIFLSPWRDLLWGAAWSRGSNPGLTSVRPLPVAAQERGNRSCAGTAHPLPRRAPPCGCPYRVERDTLSRAQTALGTCPPFWPGVGPRGRAPVTFLLSAHLCRLNDRRMARFAVWSGGKNRFPGRGGQPGKRQCDSRIRKDGTQDPRIATRIAVAALAGASPSSS